MAAATSILAAHATAQPQPAAAKQPVIQRRYQTNMAEEDWSFLKDPVHRIDFWDPLKYIQLPRPDWYLSLGGEIRLSPQGVRIRGDEQIPSTIDNYWLQRYLFSIGLQMGTRFRLFTELQSGIIKGRINSPRPNDQDLLEFHQLFFEYRSPKERPRQLLLRLGRQELNIGSGRLIAPSQGLNVKRSFDGLMSSLTSGKWSVEGGVARLVKLKPGIFDDPPDSEQDFWGVNLVRRLPSINSQANFYYLGISRKSSIYAQGIGPEERQTVGGRFTGRWRRLDYNYDFIGQWGSFKGLPARAWAVSTDTGFSTRLGRQPLRLGLTFNSSSGDRDPNDSSLETFNPLFPGNSYSGIVGLLGPSNLTDFTPSIKVPLMKNLLIAFEVPSYYRTSTRDGVYSIDQRLILRGQSNRESYVGTNPGVIVAWQTTRHLNVTGAITRFQSGAFLSDTLFRNGFGFYSIAVTYRF